MLTPFRLLRPCGFLLVAVICPSVLSAAVRVKDADATALNAAGSWAGDTTPNLNDIAHWNVGSSLSNALGGSVSWVGLRITDPTGTVEITGAAGQTLTLGGPAVQPSLTQAMLNLTGSTIDLSTATADLTISSNLTMLANSGQVWNVQTGRTLTLQTGVFTRGAGATLNIQGAGTVATTNITNTNGIVGTWARIGVGAGTRYATISGGNVVALSGTAAATAANVTDATGTVNYQVAAAGTVGAEASFHTLTYTGAAGTIAGSFTANGLLNAGTGNLTFSGDVTIGADRELVLTSPDDTRTLVLDGRILDNAAGASAVTFAGGQRIPSGTTVVSSKVTVAGDNTYSGQSVISGGTVEIRHNNALGAIGAGAGTTIYTASRGRLQLANNITVAEALTFVGGDPSNTFFTNLLSSSGNNTVTGLISAPVGMRIGGTGGTVLNIAGGLSSTSQVVFNPGGGTVNFITTPVTLGTGNFYLDQSGLITVGVAGNTWGSTVVGGGGTVRLDVENALPTSTTVLMGVSYNAGLSTLNLNGFNQTVGQLTQTLATGATSPGFITSATAAVLTINQSATTTFSGQFTGELGMTKGGTGTLNLTGASTHGGVTRTNGGTLALGNVDALQNSTLDTGVSGAQTVTFTVAGTNTYDLGGLQGADALALGANSLNVGGNDTDTTYTGNLTGTGALTKVGTAKLLIDGTVSGLSLIDVTEGTFGGSGAIVGAVTVGTDGALQGGAAVGSDLEINGAVTLAGGAEIKLTLGAGLNNSTLARLGGLWAFDNLQAFTFTDLGATTGIYEGLITGLTGSEAGLATIENWVITNPGMIGEFTFTGGQVNLEVTNVPEPGAAVSLLGGVALLLGLRRRRFRH